jgi:phosphopantothenoylcysteine decarboxylase/phosphopantothenate--cysteine ligase
VGRLGSLSGKRILLGVTGGMAAYKAVELLRLLVKAGAEVSVAMTHAATEFVQPLTFRELSYRPVAIDVFDEPKEGLMQHLYLADSCDAIVVAPATANTMAKIAHGIADNALCTVVLASTAPIILAPAMDSDMWANPATQENVAKLRSRGFHFAGPGRGPLARKGKEGWGRMVDPEEVFQVTVDVLGRASDWQGLQLLVTAGPTYEPIDPVRFVGNRSSGKMGYAIAAAAQARGAEVTLVSGPSAQSAPAGVKIVRVQTTLEMREACLAEFEKVDACVKAAAPADFRVAEPAEQKMKKSGHPELVLRLLPNPDILSELGTLKKQQVLVGFAAETEKLVAHAREKLQRKNCDLMVANDVTAPDAGFEVDTNRVKLLFPDGRVEELPVMEKSQLAHLLLDRIGEMVRRKQA